MTKIDPAGNSAEPAANFADNYKIDPLRVADALVRRVRAMADERARMHRALVYSVEMIEAPDFEIDAGRIN